jgi:hypothetical protein
MALFLVIVAFKTKIYLRLIERIARLMQVYTPRSLIPRLGEGEHPLAAINHTALLGKLQQCLRKQQQPYI